MKLRTTLMALAVGAAVLPTAVASAAPGPNVVIAAHYSFNAGATAAGLIPAVPGRGGALRIRSADGGQLRFIPRGTGRAVWFPARCGAAATCPRVVLEGSDDPRLDPGTRNFRYGAVIRATQAQTGLSANVMQKGVATAESQWKLQIGGRRGRANCVLVGRGSTHVYMARSNVSVTDGRWHQVTCLRATNALYVYVDSKVQGAVAIPPGLVVANGLPLRLGAQNLSDRTDRYGGAVDEAFMMLT
jgi:Concanavalin A-like lectin/glucanases superfamily